MADTNSQPVLHELLQEQIELSRIDGEDSEIDYQRLFGLISSNYEKADRNRRDALQTEGLMNDEMRNLHFDMEREIDARALAENRMFEAVSALDEGFAYYDSDDRLVACNEQYASIFFPNGEKRIEPGITFAELAEAYIDSSSEAQYEGLTRDQWLKKRIAHHRNPRRPIERQIHDGRWFIINERKTREGGTVTMLTNITALKEREVQMRRNEEQSTLYNEIVMELTRSRAVLTGDLGTAIKEISEVASKILKVDRSSIWLFDDGRSVLRCKNLYEDSDRTHKIGPELLVTKCHNYLEEIHNAKIIVADNVYADPRLEELNETFMKPRDIRSVIHAPVRGPGYAEGVAAVAMVGEERHWNPAEVKFVAALADVAGMAIKANDRKRSRERMMSAIERAELANRSKSEFLANMSHELRTPLNSILGFAELLQIEKSEPYTPEQYREYARDIHESGNHLLDLINDILDISKIEAGKYELREEDVHFSKIVSICSRLIMERARDRGLNVTICDTAHVPILWGDNRALKQVLLNLLSNAVKFTRKGGDVTVSADVDANGNFSFTVADTGIGIPPEDIEKALKPFVQLDNNFTRKHDGTGLGLPLAKSLMDMHQGSLTIQSKPGSGTRVTATMPAYRVKNASQTGNVVPIAAAG